MGKVAPSRARIGELPVGDAKFVRLGFGLVVIYEDSHVYAYSQRSLKLTLPFTSIYLIVFLAFFLHLNQVCQIKGGQKIDHKFLSSFFALMFWNLKPSVICF